MPHEITARVVQRHTSAVRRTVTTGDNSSVGFFVPLPKDLADQFPSLGTDDASPPHVTILYVGAVPKNRQEELIATATRALAREPCPILAKLGAPDFFVQPDKDRRVWYSSVSFSKDVAAIRDRLWSALEAAGFKVEHAFPLAMIPHVTLAYVPDSGSRSVWRGPTPSGVWSFDAFDLWGLDRNVSIPLGTYHAQTFSDVANRMHKSASLPIGLDHTGLQRLIIDRFSKQVDHRWVPFVYGDVRVEKYKPTSKSPTFVRFNGSPDVYVWSARQGRFYKTRLDVPSEAMLIDTSMSEEEVDFYRQSPEDIVAMLQTYPRSLIHTMRLRREMLPDMVLQYLSGMGYRFS